MDVDLLLEYGPRLLRGLMVTVELVVESLVFGGVLAISIALARTSKFAILRMPATIYIFAFRGTPVLAQMYLIYYGAGQYAQALSHLDFGFFTVDAWVWFREAYFCAILALSLNTAAYTAEILRGGIQSVPAGEIEAGRAIGLSRLLILLRIILPNAYRIALPAYGNEVIMLIKTTALAAIITILDLTGETRVAFARSFSFSVYAYAAILYLVLIFLVTRAWNRLEASLNPQRLPPLG